MIPHEDEQQALRIMRELRADGCSLQAIAERMKVNGHKISHVTVKQALMAG